MLNVDALKQLKQLKTDIKASRNLAEGVVKGSAHKFGFVTLDSGKDVFLPADEMQKVLPGDRIEVEVKKEPKNKTVAIVEKLLKSPVKEFHGKYVVKGKAHFVDADIPGLSRWIFIPPPKRNKAKANDLVKCRLTQHPIKQGKAQAAVLEVLGNETTPGIEWDYAISKHGLATEWSDAAQADVDKLNSDVIAELKAGRSDCSDIPFVTIDASSTEDMDDAVWASESDGGWQVKVAIADPGCLVSRYPNLEKDVLSRATSVYFPGRAIAMFPARIGSDLCSLREGEDRLAKVVSFHVSPDGKRTDFSIEQAWIRSRAKLSYRQVATFLCDNDAEALTQSEVKDSLQSLFHATQAMRKYRATEALVNGPRSEFYIELGPEQKIAAIRPKPQTPAHDMIEDAMLAVNQSIANYLAEQDVPGIFIVHDGLREDRIEGVRRALAEVLSEQELASLSSLKGFVEVLHKLDAPEMNRYRQLITKQMSKSVYALAPAPHFGLGFAAYTTFTSPLRKANDYLLHRQIDHLLAGKKQPAISAGALEKLDSAVQAARSAVTDVEQWLKCQFIAGQKGVFEAEILRAFSTGFHVRLLENGIEGFVSTKEMDGKYSFDQDWMRITGGGQSFELGQTVTVTLSTIDWSRKQIQFALAETEAL